MFLRIAWGPVVGALLASGWWALSVWGFPSPGDTVWRVPVAVLAFSGTIVLAVVLLVAMIEDCMKSFPDVTPDENKEAE